MANDPFHFALVGPFPPYRGGIAHFHASTRRILEARGHRVSAWSFSRQYPGLLFPGKSQFEPGEDGSAAALRVLDTVNPWTWFSASRRIAAGAPDAVVFAYWMPFFAPALGTVARRLAPRSRILALVHNALPHERRPGDRALGRWFLSRCHGLVCFSDAVGKDLRGLGLDAPLRRLHHPVYDVFGAPVERVAARRRLGLSPDGPVALFFGYVRRYKGLDVLIEALPRILCAHPELTLVVAGEFYEDEAATRARIAELGLGERVHLHADYIPQEEVTTFFSAADVVVQPYVSGTQSGVAQVAFHFERPMILTEVGGLAEVVGDDAGLVVPPSDPEALAAAVVRFFREGLAASLAEGVRRRKREYSWDRVAEALEELAGA